MTSTVAGESRFRSSSVNSRPRSGTGAGRSETPVGNLGNVRVGPALLKAGRSGEVALHRGIGGEGDWVCLHLCRPGGGTQVVTL